MKGLPWGTPAPDTSTVDQAVRTPTSGMTREVLGRYAIAMVVGTMAPFLLSGIGLLTNFRSLVLGAAVSFAVAGISLNILMGYAGQISLGHFALVGLGAFTSGKLSHFDGPNVPYLLSILVAALVCAAVAFGIGLPALRLRGIYLAVVTIGFAYVMEQSLFQSSLLSSGSGGVELVRPYIGFLDIGPLEIGPYDFRLNVDYLSLLVGILVVVWLIDSNLTRSKLGRAFHAIRADEDVAASFGINVARYKLLAFTISGFFAGLAGAMYGHLFGRVNFQTFSFDRSLLLVIIVVLGGLGSRAGVTAAAAFYGIFPLILDEIWGNDAIGWDLIVGALLLLYTIARHPTGLAGAVRHEREKKAKRELEARGFDADEDDDAIPTLPDLPRPTGLAERPAHDGPVVEAVKVTVDFGGLRAVDGASLAVPRGKIVGLIGPNGAGKTTLFNAISGAVTPTDGAIRLLGEDVSSMPAHARANRGLGRTFQLVGLAKDLSVTENLLLAQHQVAAYDELSALVGLGRAPRIEDELRARAAETIEALGFERYTDTPVRNLSGGQQRIVEIACALVTAPEIVMLDEPSAGMAPAAVENLAVRLRDLRDELGRTLLLIEHNIPLVLDVCDELYVMAQGAILTHGDPDEVISDPGVIAAYLGEQLA